VIETPAVILVGMVAFGLAFALLYRSVASAWPAGIHPRAWRLALVIWLATVFSEFMGSFNVLHQPLSLSVLAWGLWAVSAVAGAYTLVYVLDRGRSERTGQRGALLAGRQELR
jgi:hypothetical protein